MGANARAIDRIMPESIGGYPVNYGLSRKPSRLTGTRLMR